ncbi:Mo-dependent nitrogenase C-terminal domain-containing protein [Leptolyngbya ohadii]|uniref:Mo-dependent nitrogenase C-terminal domain-containing protein n=1 Tax=Leptolyngbya ohadii TaxID=1962290 RepID=UPI000B59E234|nr:Mo-dependent nitrogenase C-terminal domain-containing protein [Leptolyngbya ohadii]
MQASHPSYPPSQPAIDLLLPLRRWIDNIELNNPQLAHRICHLIPAQCPFERDVQLFGRTLFHIPPMCKLNPLYEQVVGLRFRAMCYLADVCGEDVSRYC